MAFAARSREEEAQMRDRRVELVQILLERRAQQQDLVRRLRGVGPRGERRQREPCEARVARFARLREIALGNRSSEAHIVGPLGEPPAQLPVLAPAGRSRRQDLDHFVVARRRDRRRDRARRGERDEDGCADETDRCSQQAHRARC